MMTYLFGSRVRGDHRPDSDVDVCIQWADHLTDSDLQWWGINNEDDFAAIKPRLPGPLKVLESGDQPWTTRVVGADMVYQDRNVRCMWLPPRS